MSSVPLFTPDESPQDKTDRPHFTITGSTPNDITLTYGDVELTHVKELTLTMSATSIPELTITFLPGRLDVDIETFLRLNSDNMTLDQYRQIERAMKEEKGVVQLIPDDGGDANAPF